MLAVELFAGAGGMTLGFQQAGWTVHCAVESDPRHAATHRRNFPGCALLECDIRTVTPGHFQLADQPLDLIFGGPPCQGFSVGGVRRQDDERNDLVLEFGRVVIAAAPRYFVMENVQGLAGRRKDVLEAFVDLVQRAGYEVVEPFAVLNASDFGVPQNRKRLFVLGYRTDQISPNYPEPHSAPAPTVWDALGDLPSDPPLDTRDDDIHLARLGRASPYARALRSPRADAEPVTLTGYMRAKHSAAVQARFAATGPGEREPISRFLRLDKAGLAPTLRAGTNRQRGAFTAPRPIHPTQDRCITVREAARLSSFPDSFEFHPTRWYGYAQVGNAVPPLLARAVATSVLSAARSREGIAP